MREHSTAQYHDLQSIPSLAVTLWSWRVSMEYFPPIPMGKLTFSHSITTCTSAFNLHSCAIQWRRASSRCASNIEFLRRWSGQKSQAAYFSRWHTCTTIPAKATSSKGDCFSLTWWIQFVNFTGSVSLGKQLASLCGQYLKYVIILGTRQVFRSRHWQYCIEDLQSWSWGVKPQPLFYPPLIYSWRPITWVSSLLFFPLWFLVLRSEASADFIWGIS